MAGYSTSAVRSPKPLVPAWMLSIAIHGAMIVALCVAMNPSQQGAPDGNHDQSAADHVRALLVPERQVFRDHRILIDQRLNLERAVDKLIFGKLIDNQLTVIGRIASEQPAMRSCCRGGSAPWEA